MGFSDGEGGSPSGFGAAVVIVCYITGMRVYQNIILCCGRPMDFLSSVEKIPGAWYNTEDRIKKEIIMKRLLSLLLIVVMILSLAACSAKKDADEDRGAGADATDGTSATRPDGAPADPDKSEKRAVYAGYTRTDGDSGDVSIMEKYTFEGVRVSSINVDGDIVDIKYDEDGSVATVVYEDRTLWVMKWDGKGDICELTTYYSNDTSETTLFQRDDEGRAIREDITDGNGEKIRTIEHGYNEKGDLISEVYINKDGEKTVDTKRIYDEHGNVVQRIGIDFEEVYVNGYDEAGNLVSVTNDDGSRKEFTYNADGNVASRISYRDDGTLSATREYTYYPSGELHTEIYYTSGGKLNYTYTHNYTEIEMTEAEYRTVTQLIDIVATEM